MKCHYCGWKNPATVTFCRKCGAPLIDSSDEAAHSSSPSVEATRDAQQGPRAKRKSVWLFVWILLACLVIGGAGFAWWTINVAQSTTAISQTLQIYCNALQHANYPQAYAQWTSSIQMSESDFAYVQKNKARTTGCTINTVSKSNASAQANLTFFFADGSTATDQVNLVLENGVWKIKSQSLS